MIPALEKTLADAESAEGKGGARETVREADIAAIVSRWAGVPVEKMLEGERDKLLAMEAALGKRVVGQGGGGESCVDRSASRPRGIKDPGRPTAVSSFWGRQVWVKPSSPRHSRVHVRR